MNYGSISYPDHRKIRLISAVSSIFLHVLLIILFSILVVWQPKPPEVIELDWGGVGGGIGMDQIQPTSETKPTQLNESPKSSEATKQPKVDMPTMKSTSEEVIPSAKKVKPKPDDAHKREKTYVKGIKYARRGGAGGGAGGGIGKSTGYSIDWSGTGSRRLLSGRIPQYPEGTDKEMPVLLQFAVLPDGSVSSIIPLKRSDELLERESVSALRTWRFDPLPPQFEQKAQVGKVTFIFKLE